MKKLKRVVVTGIGSITPIGNNVEEYWISLISGKSGSAPITYFNTEKYKTKFACELKNYDPSLFFSKKEQRKLDPCAQYGILASSEAVENSKIDFYKEKRERVGVIWSSGIGGLLNLEESISDYVDGGRYPRFSPFFIPKMLIDITAGFISMNYGLYGPNYATVSSCASSSNAIVDAYHLICLGKADIMVTGGSEAAITQSGVGGFNALHALSTRNEDYKTASRPFDKDRDGFVLGEGAGCLILEEYNHAQKRGANIYAEIGGVGMSGDAYHITAPHPEGRGVIIAMRSAVEDAEIEYSKVDHINAHGTSTILGDLAEVRAIQTVFKKNVYNIDINSTKSMTGHLLGAAGAIEAIATILPLSKKIIPPTINLFQVDERIDPKISFTPNKAIKREVKISICNTFGFGGHNVCILFKQIDVI
ncbi:MAG: beta-ketoacyl-ACP synthase II [Flavobacteriales bacterium]|jgi:3-oxoacyl-[acyl-carrier-protein] synthase II|uniref:beta-ketoacyl-ACP synthase II n=1 Tax=Blattabacterium sp. (Mastotermes darwiniensis) TaxID=39768 RepID=UPI000231DEFD|nr:beta-ketoacyl-ACP synthase II [Blattabacterium sp. (Mastotermes darwiniensis)]AER40817.1 putative 3-oxoacyl-(acyl-carrier-protein) synthase [Blattabacterium sp. (Mastotermes darwiniensis) str. MADAR]MDR1804664.1 beta-ketoacyl-ACP synthase II [Flavobacteriales bacterium]